MSPASAADRQRYWSSAAIVLAHGQSHLFVEQPIDVPQVGDVIAKDRAHLRTTTDARVSDARREASLWRRTLRTVSMAVATAPRSFAIPSTAESVPCASSSSCGNKRK